MAKLRFAALAAVALLAGCTGGGTSHAVPPAHTAPAGNTTVALSLMIPHVVAAHDRTPRYLSAATKSVFATVNGGTPLGFDATPGSPNCTAGTSGTTCTFSLVAPIAFDSFAVAAYDMPRTPSGAAQGNVLSEGTIQVFINEGTDNQLQLSLSGKVATVTLDIPDQHPWFWCFRFIGGNVVAKDAAGYTIVGTYDAPIALKLTPYTLNWLLPYPVRTSSDGLGQLAFTGNPAGPVTLTATAANNATDSKLLTPVVQPGTVVVSAPDINPFVDVPYNRAPSVNNPGGLVMLDGLFATPRAVAFDGAGNVYMTDNGPKSSSSSPNGPAVWAFPAGYCSRCSVQPVVLPFAAFGDGTPLVVATDAANNVLYVATASAIYRFALPLTSSSTPVATIAGPTTGLAGITGIAVGANELAVSTSAPSLETFAKNASGDAAPQRTIAGATTTLQTPHGLAYDASGKLWVADAAGNDVAAFAPAANGNTAPSSALAGSATALNAPQGVAFDRTGVIYVVDHSGRTHLYAAGATGNAAPQGSTSGATSANGIAVMP